MPAQRGDPRAVLARFMIGRSRRMCAVENDDRAPALTMRVIAAAL